MSVDRRGSGIIGRATLVGSADQAAGQALWRTYCKSTLRFRITAAPYRVLCHAHWQNTDIPNRHNPSLSFC